MILLDTGRIERTLKRMAYQIMEMAHGKPVYIVALNERGSSIAMSMKTVIESVSGKKVPFDRMDVDSAQDFKLSHPIEPGTCLIIVDDVIFSGQTLQLALDHIEDLHSFQKICVSVLVDRGHRKYPIFAEIVGMNIPTKLNEKVNLLLSGKNPEKVVLEKI